MKIKLYHGSNVEVRFPDLSKSHKKIDFGAGFYLTEDKKMASKWASNKKESVVNEYELDLNGLKICHLKLDEIWLNYVAKNRGFLRAQFNDADYDVIIGPTADDRIFTTIRNYLNGFLTTEKTIEYLNIMDFSEQIVLKSEKATNSLVFVKSTTLSLDEKKYYLDLASKERIEALSKIEKYAKMQREMDSSKVYFDLSEYEGDDRFI